MRKAEGGRGDELGEPIGDARDEERSMVMKDLRRGE